MNLGEFIDNFKDAIAKRVVESYPPLYRPSENGGTLPSEAAHGTGKTFSPWGRSPTPSEARPSP